MPGESNVDDKKKAYHSKYFSFGIQLATVFAFYVLGGVWLDKKFDTLPLFLIIGVIFAFISFGYLMWKLYRNV